MATDLKKCHGVIRYGMGCVLSVICAYIPAYALTDPTQPPEELSLPSDGRGDALEANGLQAIILSPGRHAAIIDGQTVEQGAEHGDAKLIEVNESGVVLQGPQGRQRLSLFPGVVMKKNEVKLPVEIEMKPAASKVKLVKPQKYGNTKEEK